MDFRIYKGTHFLTHRRGKRVVERHHAVSFFPIPFHLFPYIVHGDR
jgi:hypothetical protein